LRRKTAGRRFATAVIAMSREAFGPTLRRQRLRQGVTLEQIAAATHISIELLTALEANDLSAWPSGIYARAYIRQYAAAVDLDPDETVDEFCRHFPHGDRRARATMLEHAAIVGHEPAWADDLPPELEGVDRRDAVDAPPAAAATAHRSPLSLMLTRLRRAFLRA
jgi:transcriptional regulator with XRE-family HTH domain